MYTRILSNLFLLNHAPQIQCCISSKVNSLPRMNHKKSSNNKCVEGNCFSQSRDSAHLTQSTPFNSLIKKYNKTNYKTYLKKE